MPLLPAASSDAAARLLAVGLVNWSVLYYLLVVDFILYLSHKKKRVKQIKKLMQRGLMDPEKADPFSLFLETSDITYCLYRDSERVLGNTFGMCILQVPPQASLSLQLGFSSWLACC